MTPVLKASFVMFAYAVALVVIGWTTFLVSPPGSSALTALLIPGIVAALMIACGVGTLMIRSNRLLGMLGIHVGLLLPLLFAIAVAGGRLPKSINSAGSFNQAIRDNPNGVVVGKERADGVPHPAGYQAVGLSSIVALSGFAFVVLLLQRPKVEPAAKGAKEPVESGE